MICEIRLGFTLFRFFNRIKLWLNLLWTHKRLSSLCRKSRNSNFRCSWKWHFMCTVNAGGESFLELVLTWSRILRVFTRRSCISFHWWFTFSSPTNNFNYKFVKSKLFAGTQIRSRTVKFLLQMLTPRTRSIKWHLFTFYVILEKAIFPNLLSLM